MKEIKKDGRSGKYPWGVHYLGKKAAKPFQARFRRGAGWVHAGTFETPEAAHKAALKRRKQIGENISVASRAAGTAGKASPNYGKAGSKPVKAKKVVVRKSRAAKVARG